MHVALFDQKGGIEQAVIFYDGTPSGLQTAQETAEEVLGIVTLDAAGALTITEGNELRFCKGRPYIG